MQSNGRAGRPFALLDRSSISIIPASANELECLKFVLSDLGWDGYLGFVEEGRDNLHIGCAPHPATSLPPIRGSCGREVGC